MDRDSYDAEQARAILGYQSAEAFEQALRSGHVPPADGEDGELGPYWFIESLDQAETLSLGEIAKLAGVNRATPQKWHRSPTGKAARGYEKATPHPMRTVAEAMGIPTPEADERRPRYPRPVVIGFLKAIGYMDARGQLVEEIQNKGPGRWVPVEPTIDPHPVQDRSDPEKKIPLAVDPLTRGRLRYYAPHAFKVLGYRDVDAFEQAKLRRKVPEADGYDELQRPYWWLETLNEHKVHAAELREKRRAGPEPDGYTADGQPFRLLPEDNYYAKKAAGPAASEAESDAE